MGIDKNAIQELVDVLVARGLGLYGKEKMAEICYDSGVALLDDNSTDCLDDDMEGSLSKFLVNYARFNIAAKMTVMVLVKKFKILLPEELQRKKKRKSRFRRLMERRRRD